MPASSAAGLTEALKVAGVVLDDGLTDNQSHDSLTETGTPLAGLLLATEKDCEGATGLPIE